VIKSFRNKALDNLYHGGGGKGLPAQFVPKIRRVLLAIDQAHVPEDLSQPGFGMHALTGDLAGFWSITVTRNWRIVFRFEGQDAIGVDFVDYH
jgi:toxin HigB-1